MNILKNITLTWWQVGIVKVCLLSFGMAIGAYWSKQLTVYIPLFLAIGIIFGIYLIYIRFKQ